MKPRKSALGFRAHSGWAVMVAVSDSPDGPKVVDRRRVEMVDRQGPRSNQPYHAAAEMKLEAAEKFLRQYADRSSEMARASMQEALAALEQRDWQATRCCILQAAGRPLPDLASILGSHPLIHTAEGEFFRNALRVAAESLGLAVTAIKERELLERAGKGLGLSVEDLQQRATDMGKPIGRPWTQDEKLSCIAGWLILRTSP